MPRPSPSKNKPTRCRHDGTFAVVSPIRGEDESTMGEPLVLCRGCGAIRHRFRDNWSPSLADDLAAEPGFVFPEGSAILVHANALDSRDVDRNGKKAWNVWVDADGYGRRLLFGRLRPEEVDRAERDSALAAGMPAAEFDQMKAEHRRQDEEAAERSGA